MPSITLDGNTITRSTNQISDVIAGTTISLVGADKNSTITLNITPDTSGIESMISDFVSKYNALMTEITNQFTYTQNTSSTNYFKHYDFYGHHAAALRQFHIAVHKVDYPEYYPLGRNRGQFNAEPLVPGGDKHRQDRATLYRQHHA